MNMLSIKSSLIGLAMIAAAALAMALTPTKLTASTAPRIDLETMIPKQFGDWHQLKELDVISVSPEVQATINKIYQQTLSRTYINSNGQQIMLALAYGDNQTDSLQVHKPEQCYPAQGFQILHSAMGSLHLVRNQKNIPVKRLVAQQGARIEPITYWITVGNQVAVNGWKWKLAQLTYGLTGKVPDGMLVRVSSISADEKSSFSIQQDFINAMLDGMQQTDRVHLVGVLGS
ncbi:MAG: EpsI family protein [Sulfuriferula sp.]|nr:EpsI family protein [Sulfuriferula sp.]